MADPKGFTHIQVTPEPEEDTVIRAGVGAQGAPSVPEGSSAHPQTQPQQIPPARPQTQPQPAPAPMPAPAPQQVAQPQQQPSQQAVQQRRATPSAASAPARKKDEYHETTLEDIESTKMSTMQKCVIVGAIVLLIIGAVYYFTLMG
jgi:cobalamin biosynthesis Mg chelatase CobN